MGYMRILGIVFVAISHFSFAESRDKEAHAISGAMSVPQSEIEMNGIRLNQYGDYTKLWKLVTVRYRKDTGEMRFTYANDTAYGALKSASSEFPDGSVFAKVGFKSGVDPAFNSSIVPSGARRFQFMVKDKKKYSETDGWGYALFTSEGKLFESDIKVQTASCHACHKIVPERDFVFSEPIEFSPFAQHLTKTYDLLKNKSHLVFQKVKPNDPELRRELKKLNVQDLYSLEGEIRANFFMGTLDEVTPVLIHQLIEVNPDGKKRVAVGFVSEDQKTYKVVTRDLSLICKAEEYPVLVLEMRSDYKKGEEILRAKICYHK